jgi:hypothetical protein
MKKALIQGTRVAQVEQQEFPVHPDLYWVDCEDHIEADKYTYQDGVFTKIPDPAPPVDPGVPSLSSVPTSGPWVYLCSMQTDMTTPPAGQIRFNNLDPVKVNQITVHTVSDNAFDLHAVYARLRSKDQIYIQDQDNATRWVRYLLAAPPSDRTGWWLLSVGLIESRGNFISGNNKLAVIFGGTEMNKSIDPVRGDVKEDVV